MKRTFLTLTLLATLVASVAAVQARPFDRGFGGGPPGAELFGMVQRLEIVADQVGI